MSCLGKETINHPPHYNKHPSGVECIEVAEHFGFNIGNAIKYLWRSEHKDDVIEDLKKAAWYIEREIQKRRRQAAVVPVSEPVVPGKGRVQRSRR